MTSKEEVPSTTEATKEGTLATEKESMPATIVTAGVETNDTKKRKFIQDDDGDIKTMTDKNNNEKNDDNNNGEQQHRMTPITADGDMPQKKFYRQRAHCNPLSHNDSFAYPITPKAIDWSEEHYPTANESVVPTVLDIGCGFGGLTIALASILPSTEYILGMEIRAKVTEYVRLRIVALRKEHQNTKYTNCSVLRTNSMKYLPNFFTKSSLKKLFFCFPDPHFKRKNHGRRIVTVRLLTEYAYLLQVGGRLYCITDVKELHEWHVRECNAHPLFRRISDEAMLSADPCVEAMKTTTEESKKVDRNGGNKYYAVYERIDPTTNHTVLNADNFFTNGDDGGDNEGITDKNNG